MMNPYYHGILPVFGLNEADQPILEIHFFYPACNNRCYQRDFIFFMADIE